MKLISTLRTLFFLINLSALTPSAFSEEFSFGIGSTVGLPNLISFDLRFPGLKRIEGGLSLGSFPADRLIQRQIALEAIPVDLQQEDPYALYPSASFKLTSFSPYFRVYFSDEGQFFFQTSYAIWRFSAALNADLQNETTDVRTRGVIAGTLTINQPLVTPSLGWRFKIANAAILDLGFGASFLLKTDPSLNVGGSLSNILTLVPDAQNSFDQAIDQAGADLENAVTELRNQISFLPAIFVGLIIPL
jgi:hypothetical protein